MRRVNIGWLLVIVVTLLLSFAAYSLLTANPIEHREPQKIESHDAEYQAARQQAIELGLAR